MVVIARARRGQGSLLGHLNAIGVVPDHHIIGVQFAERCVPAVIAATTPSARHQMRPYADGTQLKTTLSRRCELLAGERGCAFSHRRSALVEVAGVA